MRIEAFVEHRAAAWHYAQHGCQAVGVWTEKREGRGEDAEPLVLHDSVLNTGLLAVFDGAGGAGAASAGVTPDGTDRSQAWVAPRAARAITEEWMSFTPDAWGDRAATDLHDRLANGLAELRSPDRRKITGSMRKELPTTLAALHYRVDQRIVSWDALWAGDSRCFLLDPAGGLQQLSRDDADSDDALALLISDPPMTNIVRADAKFEIHVSSDRAPTPCVLLCATDGFFGYVTVPAQFEHVLLRTLGEAPDLQAWTNLLASTVAGYTGDDASLALVAFGYQDYAQLREAFRQREHEVRVEYVDRVSWAMGEDTDRDTFLAVRAESWRRYRPSYEQRLPFHDRRQS